jgi:hypothetical protein
VVLGAAVLVVALVVEIAALPVATRLVGDALERCLPFDDVEVETIDRPVLPRLLVGRARGVELEATGLRFDEIRVERARLALPEVGLPWALRPPPEAEATLELELSERDVQDFLAEQAPFGLEPVVELTPGIAAIGVEPLPVRVRLSVEVRDGVLRVSPVGEVPSWFGRLGLDLAPEIPEGVELDRLDVRQDALLAVLRVEVVPGIDGTSDCTGPLAAGGPGEGLAAGGPGEGLAAGGPGQGPAVGGEWEGSRG